MIIEILINKLFVDISRSYGRPILPPTRSKGLRGISIKRDRRQEYKATITFLPHVNPDL